MIIVDEETLEAGEYLLTPNKIPSQLSSNMEDSEICGHSQAHKRRNDQVVVHQGFIGTEWEGYTGIASQSEPIHLQDNYHIILENYNP